MHAADFATAGETSAVLQENLLNLFAGMRSPDFFASHGQSPAQLGRRKHFHFFAPTENPTLNFLQAPELQLQFQSTATGLTNLLGVMPDSFAHQLSGERLEAQSHENAALAAKNAEARIEKFCD
jgi:hypothetical protein